MRIVQVLTTLAYGDAIGNDVLAMKKAFQHMGYTTEILAEHIDGRLPEGTAKPINRLDFLEEKDVVIYHYSTGTELNYKVANTKARLVVCYHNITPPKFFHGYSLEAEKSCEEGLKAGKYLAEKAEFCWADSEFNKQDLIEMGFKMDIKVLPILIPFEDYNKEPRREVIRKYSGDGMVNVLFTGRVAPNKKHEDIIKTFYYYKKYVNEKSRLFLVGGYAEKDRYYQKLQRYVRELGVQDVIFTGHIKFDEILAYYQLADVFLCMSEHEGFCVPLVEAMQFQVPVVAYESTAVPDTLAEGGLLLDEKDPMYAALAIDRVVTDRALVNHIREKQRERLNDFSYDVIYKQLKKLIEEIAGEPE